MAIKNYSLSIHLVFMRFRILSAAEHRPLLFLFLVMLKGRVLILMRLRLKSMGAPQEEVVCLHIHCFVISISQ